MSQEHVDRIIEKTDLIRSFLSEARHALDASAAAAVRASGDWTAAFTESEREWGPRISDFLDDAYATITKLDESLSDDERNRCRAYHRLTVQPFFLGCAFVRWSIDKPFGYPGDFKIVEMLFDNRDDGQSPLARLLSRYTLNCGPTRAHRARMPWVHRNLKPLTAAAERPLDVLSFACGPERVMREFYRQGERCNLVLSDFDSRALEYAMKKIDEVVTPSGVPARTKSVELSAYRLVKDATSIEILEKASSKGGFDVVLVLGLLDYLDDRSLARFLDTLVHGLVPKGRVLLTNLHSENPWRSFMDYVGHWEVIHRTKAHFEKLVLGADRLRTLDYGTDESGTNLLFMGERA